MPATPIWFGPAERPLFGWLHVPTNGHARAGVVLCPPLGREYLDSHYAFRALAERLSAQDICALRFDYDGTGDSAGGDDDPDRVASWLASVMAATETLRATGVTSIIALGMRIGATFAATLAARAPGLDGLILWDPVVSGRDYLIEQRALLTFSSDAVTPSPDGSVEIPGLVFAPDTANDIRALDVTRSSGPLARHVLVLTRPSRRKRALETGLDMPHVEWADAIGQAELMDVCSPYQELPLETMDRIVKWVTRIPSSPTGSIRVPPAAGPAVVGRTPSGSTITETPVSIDPVGLFGIMTEASTGSAGPTVLFMNVANEHRVGPNRMWVDLARRWATYGIRCCRFDQSGMGDSPVRHADQEPWVGRGPEAFDDVTDATRGLSPEDPSNVVLVGLCSSAYQALDSAFEVQPKGVIAIQPILSFQAPEAEAGQPTDPRRKISIPTNTVIQAFSGGGRLAFLRRLCPDLGWRIRMLAAGPRRPGRWLAELDRMGVDVLLICGAWEGRAIQTGCTNRSLKRLSSGGRFRFVFQENLEHGLLVAQQRDAIFELMTEHLLEKFLPADSCGIDPVDEKGCLAATGTADHGGGLISTPAPAC
jgi:pimeloyl-ACP methyl ester carboxylesterase